MAFTWSNQNFFILAPFSYKSHSLKGGRLLVLFIHFWGLRTGNWNFVFSDDFLNIQCYEIVRIITTTDIGWYKLKLKGKYEELREFNMSYHMSLSYLIKKESERGVKLEYLFIFCKACVWLHRCSFDLPLDFNPIPTGGVNATPVPQNPWKHWKSKNIPNDDFKFCNS